MQRLGIITELDEGHHSFRLTRRYEVVDTFLRVCRKHAQRWRALQHESQPVPIFAGVVSLLRAIAHEAWALCNDDVYEGQVFKLVISCVFQAGVGVDWGSLPLPVLRTMCPDQDEFLRCFPESWTAADVSNLMFNRPDWGMFVGIFGSLWKSVCESCQHSAASSLLATIATPTFTSLARGAKSSTGMPLTPAEVLRLCGWEGVCASLRRKRKRVAAAQHDK